MGRVEREALDLIWAVGVGGGPYGRLQQAVNTYQVIAMGALQVPPYIEGDYGKKLRHARERIRQEKGKREGRKSFKEIHPELVALAKRLRRKSPRTWQETEPLRN